MAEQHVVDLTINPEKAFFILVKAREFDEKVDNTDPDSGSNPSDDRSVDILESEGDDPTLEELMTAMSSLNIDEQLDLIALLWLGRGDFTVEEWAEAREQARAMPDKHIPDYIAGTPLAGDYIEEGLSQLGYSLDDYEIRRL